MSKHKPQERAFRPFLLSFTKEDEDIVAFLNSKRHKSEFIRDMLREELKKSKKKK